MARADGFMQTDWRPFGTREIIVMEYYCVPNLKVEMRLSPKADSNGQAYRSKRQSAVSRRRRPACPRGSGRYRRLLSDVGRHGPLVHLLKHVVDERLREPAAQFSSIRTRSIFRRQWNQSRRETQYRSCEATLAGHQTQKRRPPGPPFSSEAQKPQCSLFA